MQQTKLHVYLSFNGNCREAMSFYRDCIGGKLTLQPMKESPDAERLPPAIQETILHAALVKGGLVLMGTDMLEEEGLKKGNTVSLLLDCSTEEEARDYYRKLVEGGTARHPLRPGFSGALFGGLTDKYGNQWLLHYNKDQQ